MNKNKWKTTNNKAIENTDNKLKKYNIKKQNYERIAMWKGDIKKNKKNIKDLNPILSIDIEKGELMYKIIVYPILEGINDSLECLKIISKINKNKKISLAIIKQYKDGKKNAKIVKDIDERKFNEIVELMNKIPFLDINNTIITDMSKCKTVEECMKKMKSRVNEENN